MVTCLVCSFLFFWAVSQPQETTLEALCGSAELVACRTSVTFTSIFRHSYMVMLDVPSAEHGILMIVLGSRRTHPFYPPPPCSPAHLSSQQRPRALGGGSSEDPGRTLGGNAVPQCGIVSTVAVFMFEEGVRAGRGGRSALLLNLQVPFGDTRCGVLCC